MIFLIILKYSVWAIICLVNLVLAFRSRKPFKFIIFNAFLGVTTLLILYLTKKFSGLLITINPLTVISSAVLGVPSVILILALNFIILM